MIENMEVRQGEMCRKQKRELYGLLKLYVYTNLPLPPWNIHYKMELLKYMCVSGFFHVPLSFVHQVKGLVDVNQRHCVSGKLIHFDLAYQVVLH